MKLTSVFKILIIIAITSSCTKNCTIDGNWGAISSEDDYSELYFNNNQIRIFTEVMGIIATQSFELTIDSLKTNLLDYEIEWINPDSVVLKSDEFTLNMKRIKQGFKLSDYTNESLEQQYKEDFYSRMYKRKGIDKTKD